MTRLPALLRSAKSDLEKSLSCVGKPCSWQSFKNFESWLGECGFHLAGLSTHGSGAFGEWAFITTDWSPSVCRS